MTTPKVPMAYAAEILDALCERVEETGAADSIDAFLVEAFNDAKLDLQDAVDRRIAFDRWIKIQVAAAEEGYRYYRERKEQLERVHERFKAKTKEIMEAHPELPYSGRLGKITVANNGGVQSIEYAFGTRAVTPDAAKMFGVPEDYVTTTISYSIDHARVRAELEGGATLEWAALIPRGTHVRFPQIRKEKTPALESTK